MSITGWGMSVPERTIHSAELAAGFGLDEEWITSARNWLVAREEDRENPEAD